MTQNIEKRFDKEFPDASSFCGCYEGDLNDAWPDARKDLLAFIKQIVEEEKEKAYKEGKMHGEVDRGLQAIGVVRDEMERAVQAERNRLKEEVERMRPKDSWNKGKTCNPHCHDSGREEVVDAVLSIINPSK